MATPSASKRARTDAGPARPSTLGFLDHESRMEFIMDKPAEASDDPVNHQMVVFSGTHMVHSGDHVCQSYLGLGLRQLVF